MNVSPSAGKPAPERVLEDSPRLLSAYYATQPDGSVAAQRVAFGSLGHRGSSLDSSFNEWHVLAITQAICLYRIQKGITGPLFLGSDAHVLSGPASATALEVLAGNGVEVILADGDEYTPSPVISHAILEYNRARARGLADGIVIASSLNSPRDCGIKYNPPHGGPAEAEVAKWIEAKANVLLEAKVAGVWRIPHRRALRAATTHRRDYVDAYIGDLVSVVDLEAVRGSGLRLGVESLGGVSRRCWERIAERYKLKLTVDNETAGPLLKDARRPASQDAMDRPSGIEDRFDLSFVCDTDHARRGIVTPGAGLLPFNCFHAVAISELFPNRPQWSASAKVGKTIACSVLIDRVAEKVGRGLCEVPVGFTWFARGLYDGTLGFAGDENGDATFMRRDGTVWTTESDSFILCLLAAEVMARTGCSPDELCLNLIRDFGASYYDQVDLTLTPEQRAKLATISAKQMGLTQLAGERVTSVWTHAPGNCAPLSGIKVEMASGWFAACPSAIEDTCKIYAESLRDEAHLRAIVEEAQSVVNAALQEAPPSASSSQASRRHAAAVDSWQNEGGSV